MRELVRIGEARGWKMKGEWGLRGPVCSVWSCFLNDFGEVGELAGSSCCVRVVAS
jgi:hypothetical protein